MLRRKGRANLRDVQMTYAPELIHNLGAFSLQLHTVGEVLPSTASANSEMLAEWLHPVLRRLYKSLDAAFHIALLPAQNPYIRYIARHGILHKHHPSVGGVSY